MTAITKKPAPGKVGDNSLAAIAVQILALEKRSISNIVEIGRLLELAGEQCEHGEYGDWLKANFSWSSKTAYRYRGIYELSLEYSEKNCHVDNFGDLDISISALHLAAGFDTDDPKALAISRPRGRVASPVCRQRRSLTRSKLPTLPMIMVTTPMTSTSRS